MAYLLPSSELSVFRALEEGRLIILAGPRRCGLTHWTIRAFRRGSFGGYVSHLDLAGIRSLAQLQSEIRTELRLPDPVDSAKLAAALSDTARGGEKMLLVLNNAHRLQMNDLTWLLGAAVGPPGRRVGLVLEGAFDPDVLLESAFPNGVPFMPLIEYVEPVSPWRIITEAEEVCASRPVHTEAIVIPWLVDATGDDLGLLIEVLERLPRDGRVDEATLAAALIHVSRRGARATEIRDCIRREAGVDNTLVTTLVSGKLVSHPPPSIEPNSVLKRLYLDGIVAYDASMRGYRIRSPLTAAICGTTSEMSGCKILGTNESVLARTMLLAAYVAGAELQLRARVADVDYSTLAKETKADASREDQLARAIAAAIAAAPDGDVKVALKGVFSKATEERLSILEVARRRIKGAGETDERILEGFTFSELVALGHKGELIGPDDLQEWLQLNAGRNTAFHLRACSLDYARDLVARIERRLSALSVRKG
jgi:hypothetical protein